MLELSVCRARAAMVGRPLAGRVVAAVAMISVWFFRNAAGECVDYGEYPHRVAGIETPGTARSVAVSGSLAFVSDGEAGLQVIDVTDPENPLVVGSLDTPGHAQGVALAGSIAYVVDGASGLRLIDVTDPGNPQPLGSVDTPGDARAVAIAGSFAYVADGAAGLQVIDVSDLQNPHKVGTAAPVFARGVTVSGNYAYVEGGIDFFVVDVSDPWNPVIIGTAWTNGETLGLALQGTHVYVADFFSVGTYEVSSPRDPRWVGGVGGFQPSGLAISGSRLFAGDWAGLFQVIDITDPAAPHVVSRLDVPWRVEGIAVSGSLAYVAAGDSGLQLIDVSRTDDLLLGAASVSHPGTALDLAVSDGRGFVATGPLGLQILDLADLSNVHVIGNVDTPGYARAITTAADFAYVADGDAGLQVIDVSDPSSPQIVGTVDTPGSALGVSVAGALAFVADGPAGLQIVDVTNPHAPQIVGNMDTRGSASDVVVEAEYAYVADGEAGLQVLDVSSPREPRTVGSVDTPGSSLGVALSGSFACVADGWDGGLQVVDVSNPETPEVVGSLDTPGGACAVSVAGHHAYVADPGWRTCPRHPPGPSTSCWSQFVYGSGLRVIDILDPRRPTMVGGIGTQTDAFAVIVSGSLLHVATGSYPDRGSVRIFPTQCERLSPEDRSRAGPALIQLQGVPNPTTGRAVIRLVLPKAGLVKVEVFDLAGRRIRSLFDGSLAGGFQELSWDGRMDDGREAPHGILLVRASTWAGAACGRVVKIR